MEISDLQGKLVGIVGFGQKEGHATVEYLLKNGIVPTLFDNKPWDSWPEADREYIRSLKVNFIFGPDAFEELKGFDVVFRSPAVPRLHPQLLAQEKKGLVITSQTKWFFEHCPAKIVGVTGTKGKGTTSSLIYQMCKESFKEVFLTGNIGKAQPFTFLDTVTKDDVVVYELSSFQLQDLHTSPHVGVVLMVTSEHLDHHASTEEYRQAKEAVVKFQSPADYAIINADFEASVGIGQKGDGKKLYFSRKTTIENGCFIENKDLVLTGEALLYANSDNNPRFNLEHIKLRGQHNLENVCAATLAAICLKVPSNAIQAGIDTFEGLEHRLELVATAKGVVFYNDSFATTPETTIAALKSFTEPEILIVGGSSKNSDFTELGREIISASNIKTLIVIGQETQRIISAMHAAGDFSGNVLTGAGSMEDIFKLIRADAKEGDVVLLSPGCASFGMFADYKDRGSQFREYARNY